MLSRQIKLSTTLPILACSVLLLAACDSTPLSGGGAGDVDNSPAAIALLAPYTGIYDLQDNWNGQIGDQAFLVIEAPGSDGIAPVAFYDYDDFSNCLPQRPSTGELSKDLLSTRVFMDGILLFDQAELFLSGSSLTIEFNDDSNFGRVSVTATSLGISRVSDLGDICL